MIKVLWSRFQQCLDMFTMLLVESSSKTGLFRHLFDHVFWICNFGNTKSIKVIPFFKIFKIYFRLQKCSKKLRKSFFIWDNCIWIGIVKLSLLRRGYFSSAANVLKSSPKTCMSIRETFSNSINLAVTNESDKGAVMQIWIMLGHVYHVDCRRIFWNETF